MSEQPEEKRIRKHICAGLLAHVDAGKTTLSEGLLYFSGSIKKMGRVDKGDAFLDTYELERKRGITIFSKQAQFSAGALSVTLLDTPGHVDFSAEMERTLQVLDYAVLVVSGADGVQSHTMTLWKLLQSYQIPVFLFINKMDQQGADRKKLLSEVQRRLDERCTDFSPSEDFMETIAMCSEEWMECFLEKGTIEDASIAEAVKKRRIFPCYFGSALKGQGIHEFLEGLAAYCLGGDYPEEFGAKVYKISRDPQGNRLTHMKITGGRLSVKDLLSGRGRDGNEMWQEKADQIRIYSGSQFKTVSQAEAGMVCAVTGLSQTCAGEGLGMESSSDMPILAPVLTYRMEFPQSCDPYEMLLKLRQLEEEEPQLHLVWKESAREIHAQIMGEIEIEILKSRIMERFGVDVSFGSGSIVYKETIAQPVEGVGHFEPLRHYAEVHLLLEPGEPGSGLVFGTICSEDVLDRNWQRLILTHLEEKAHLGVLTGSEITDMRILLTAGKAHLKHTEGGDFRQATYRAVRQGLKKAESILLEPVYEFRLEVPTEMIGRSISDLQKMNGSFQPPETEGEMSVLTGSAPVRRMRSYQTEVLSYTKGRGRLFCALKGYEPCRDQEEIIQETGYDSEGDLENPTASVFCTHGAGFLVSWDQVEEYMHMKSPLRLEQAYVFRQRRELGAVGGEEEGNVSGEGMSGRGSVLGMSGEKGRDGASERIGAAMGNAGDQYRGRRAASDSGRKEAGGGIEEEQELEAIFLKTYGQSKRERYPVQHRRRISGKQEKQQEEAGKLYPGAEKIGKVIREQKSRERFLLVDGYNIIFAWEELKALARINLDSARDKLIEILCNYQGYTQDTVILVFDAYRVSGGRGSVVKYDHIYVIYTKEAETADQYIERAVHRMGKKYDVTVATSDHLIQMIIWGEGAKRISAQGFRAEVESANIAIRRIVEQKKEHRGNYVFQVLEDWEL